MTISGIRSSEMLSSIYASNYASSMNTDNRCSQYQNGSENVRISGIGNMMSAVSQMSMSDQSSIQSFMGDLTSSVQNGTFDAETMASEAPDVLTSYAEENNIDLTDLVQDMADGAQGNGIYGPPPPPPPPMMDMSETSTDSSSSTDTTGTPVLSSSYLDGLSDDEKTELDSFLTELDASVEDGTFDAETLAEEAPDSLVSYAEENGIDISELIQELADDGITMA